MQLHRYETQLNELGVHTLLISFGTEFWARGWLQETAAPFPLLLDPERRTYKAYRLGSSRLRTWGPNVLWRYAKLLRRGEKLRPAQGDPYQMGGDFIVDGNGILRLAHASKDPVDRPPIEKLLATARERRV